MANLKASKKDIRKTKRRNELNSYQRARLRTLSKKIQGLAEEGQVKEARVVLNEYTTYLDRAGRTHLIHPRQADRKKSRMVRYLNGIKPSEKVEVAEEAAPAPVESAPEAEATQTTE